MDAEAIVEEFRARGFVHVPGLFTPEEIGRLTEAFGRMPVQDKPWDGAWLKGAAPQGLQIARQIHWRSPVWGEHLSLPKVVDLASACLGEPVAVSESMVVTKPPKVGQAFPMHQDSAYYGKDGRYVVMTVYLDPCTDENGPIRFVPGSHREGKIRHTTPGKPHLTSFTFDQSVPVYAVPGDVTFFHIHTVHCSAPNTSDQARRTVRAGYAPPRVS